MRYLIMVATVAAALIALTAPSGASAGGWATVGLDPPLPAGVGPGDTWDTNMIILQHGQTPLTGLSPTITITREETGTSETFMATETDEPGVYAASVVFPEAGSWRIVADSTFGDSRLTYGPVTIEPGPGAGVGGSDDGLPVLPLLAVLGALVVGAALFGVRRQRRLHPAG
jgi:YtkA-like